MAQTISSRRRRPHSPYTTTRVGQLPARAPSLADASRFSLAAALAWAAVACGLALAAVVI